MTPAALLLLAATPTDPCAWSEPRPERMMRGLYVDDFEGQRFYEGVADPSQIRRDTRFAWFDRSDARSSGAMKHWPRGHVYRVSVLGRERFPPPDSTDPRRPCPPNDGEVSRVSVTRILARDDLGMMPGVRP